MTPPEISIVLPIFNAESTLSQTLHSLQNQRFKAFEILAVDDGSEDDTPGLLKAFAGRDARIRPLFLSKQGLIPALNAGSPMPGGL